MKKNIRKKLKFDVFCQKWGVSLPYQLKQMTMKKEMTLRPSVMESVKLMIVACIESLAKVCSDCVGEEISPAKLVRILHAVLAFTVLVFSHTHALLSVLFLIWFALTLLDCKRAGL